MTQTDEAGRQRPMRIIIPLGVALALLSVGIGVTAGFGHRLGWWPFTTGFALLRWALFGAVASVPLLSWGAYKTRSQQQRRAFAVAVAALVTATGFIVVPLQWLVAARSVPPIHDVTTAPEDPPSFEEIVRLRKDAPNPPTYGGAEVAAQQREAYPDLKPVILPQPVDQAFSRVLAVARDMGWRIVAADPQSGRVEAVDTTFWFGFKDDIVVRIRAHPKGARIDVRSVSRVGRSDLGTNARRIREYLEALQA